MALPFKWYINHEQNYVLRDRSGGYWGYVSKRDNTYWCGYVVGYGDLIDYGDTSARIERLRVARMVLSSMAIKAARMLGVRG